MARCSFGNPVDDRSVNRADVVEMMGTGLQNYRQFLIRPAEAESKMFIEWERRNIHALGFLAQSCRFSSS